jgi:DNA-binding NtrC family response regulator
LDRAAVLVVEDETFIALDLALAVEDADGEVVGPAASVQEARGLLEARPVVAAILDWDLADGDASPLVEMLTGANTIIILQTGVGVPPEIAARFPDLVVRAKPCLAADLVAQLAVMIAERQKAA